MTLPALARRFIRQDYMRLFEAPTDLNEAFIAPSPTEDKTKKICRIVKNASLVAFFVYFASTCIAYIIRLTI